MSVWVNVRGEFGLELDERGVECPLDVRRLRIRLEVKEELK